MDAELHDNSFEIGEEEEGEGSLGAGEEEEGGSDSTSGVPHSLRAEMDSRVDNRVFYRCGHIYRTELAGKLMETQQCRYQTQIKYLLDRHLAKHALDRPFRCMSCGFVSYDHGAFVDHWAQHQDGSKIMRCPWCSYENYAANLKRHIVRHRPVEMLDCSMCEFSSNYVLSMKNHFEKFHSQLHDCKYCGKIMTKYELVKHWEEAHGVKISGEKESNERDISPVQKKFKRSLKRGPKHSATVRRAKVPVLLCSFCKFSTAHGNYLANHVKSFHFNKHQCPVCKLSMTRYELIKHSRKMHGMVVGIRGRVALREQKPKNSLSARKSMKDLHEKARSKSPSIEKDPDETARSKSPSLEKDPDETARSKSTSLEKDHDETARPKSYSVEPVASTSGEKKQTKAAYGAKTFLFPCRICSYASKYKSNLRKHMDTSHSQIIRCKRCPAAMTKHELIQHALTVHGVVMKPTGRKPGTSIVMVQEAAGLVRKLLDY